MESAAWAATMEEREGSSVTLKMSLRGTMVFEGNGREEVLFDKEVAVRTSGGCEV